MAKVRTGKQQSPQKSSLTRDVGRNLGWLLIALISTLFLVLAWPVFSERFYTYDDPQNSNRPMKFAYWSALHHGESLLWSPQLFHGGYLPREGKATMSCPLGWLALRVMGSNSDLASVSEPNIVGRVNETDHQAVLARGYVKTGSRVCRITPLNKDLIPQVALLHQQVLPQTFSSRLGRRFLQDLYSYLLLDPQARGWVALKDTVVLGVITATLDMYDTEQLLMERVSIRHKVRALWRMLTHGTDLVAYVSRVRMGRFCRKFGRPYPILLTLGVEPGTSPTTAFRLMDAAHQFYKESGVSQYFLDTLADNHRAQAFYRLLGFEEQGVIAGNVIFSRKTTIS